MGRIKKEIDRANTPKKVERLLAVCLLRMTEFLNTSFVHAAIDYSGYFINGTFYSNEEMVQEFINKFGSERSTAEKAEDDNWLNLDKPLKKEKLSKTTKDSLKASSKGKRGRPSKK